MVWRKTVDSDRTSETLYTNLFHLHGHTSHHTATASFKRACLRHLTSAWWCYDRSQWPRSLRRRSTAARLLKLWVRIPPGGMEVCRECSVLSARGLCDELINRPEESHRLGRDVCHQETSKTRRLARHRAVKMQPQWVLTPGKQTKKHGDVMTCLFWDVTQTRKHGAKCQEPTACSDVADI